jgi:hypothetical protein
VPLTCQVPWPGVPAGSRVDVTAFVDPPDPNAHADAEHWLAGKLVDHADHAELSAGPRSFKLSKPGLNTIDLRIFNLGTLSIRGRVAVTLLDSGGAILDGPVPCDNDIAAGDHFLVAVVAAVDPASPRDGTPRGRSSRGRATRGGRKRTRGRG